MNAPASTLADVRLGETRAEKLCVCLCVRERRRVFVPLSIRKTITTLLFLLQHFLLSNNLPKI